MYKTNKGCGNHSSVGCSHSLVGLDSDTSAEMKKEEVIHEGLTALKGFQDCAHHSHIRGGV